MRGLLSGKAIFPFIKSQAPSGCLLFKAETVATKVVTSVPPLAGADLTKRLMGSRSPPLIQDCRFIVDVTSFCMPSS